MILYNYNKFLEYMNGFMELFVFPLMTENNHLKIFKGWYRRAYTKNFIHVGNFSVFLNVFISGGSDSEESVCNVGDPGSIPGIGKIPWRRERLPLQYPGLENSMDCIVHGVARKWTRLRDFHFTFNKYLLRAYNVLQNFLSSKDTCSFPQSVTLCGMT